MHREKYNDPERILNCARAIKGAVTRPWNIMEVCGGQMHAILRHGLDELLPENLRLIHGPGCPVCVTPIELIDKATRIAAIPDLILCTFGDMMRVPGSHTDLLHTKALGADVRMVYSPLDAVKIAVANPQRQVVFFAIGFETTAPANAMAAFQAKQQGLENFSMLVSQVLVAPAMESILASPGNCVQGFLAAGHVCAITGLASYPPMAALYKTPIVVTGFEPLDILQGILMCVLQLEEGRYCVENQYVRAVRPEGSVPAQTLMQDVFSVVDREWRGIGWILNSGLALNDSYASYDAEKRFPSSLVVSQEPSGCLSGQVLLGIRKPTDCPAFGGSCTPDHPLGATMVSAEGACAAYHRYRPAVHLRGIG